MNREETKTIIGAIMAMYPNFQSQDLGKTVDIWTGMLKNYSYEIVSMALQSYFATDTKGYAPVVGQIIEQIKKLNKKPNELSEGQVWDVVYKAICNSGYNSVYEFNNLPADIQKSVGSSQQLHEWSQMDKDDLEKVGKSQFLRSYRANKERQEYLDSLPADVTARLENNEDVKKLTDEGEN